MFKVVIKDFDLKNTFLNGQCFRFDPYKNGYLGIALNKVIYLEKHGDEFFIDGVTEQEFNDRFVDYFDLSTDYKKITDSFIKEENLQKALIYGNGMRILRQDPWEALISFIISQNNNITRIKNIISRLSMAYGTPIEYDGTIFHLFPTKEQLKNVKKEDYQKLGLGYRAGYLEQTVKEIIENDIDLNKLKTIGYFNAREELLKLQGIGPKVADCILLFGLNYVDAFPVDTWIKKVMEAFYLKKPATNKEIWDYAQNAFKGYAGIAQQFLFYYGRENKIKGID